MVRQERSYAHRTVVDKLGVKPGHAVALAHEAWTLPADLVAAVEERAGRAPAGPGEPADVVLVAVDADSDPVAILRTWRDRIRPNGGIWLLTPKRGRTGYVDQRDLIATGLEAGVVDNKVCAVNDEVSAIRFVIRRADR